MLIRDMFLAALTSVIWGVGFVVAKLGLESFSASQMTALRFLMVSVFIVMVPRPKLPWPSLIMIGATLFTGQFLLLFFAFTHGMPPGLASVSQQTQVFFTVLLSAAFLRDMPGARQLIGMVIAFAGLALIAMTVGSDLNVVGLGLAVAGAFSWAVGNVLVKRAPKVPMFPLVIWCSLVPPLPALLLSSIYDQQSVVEAAVNASWLSIGALLYSGFLAIAVAYAAWGVSTSALFGCRRGALRSAHAMHGRRGVEAHLRRSLQSSTLCRHGAYPVRTGHHRPAAAAHADTDPGPTMASPFTGWITRSPTPLNRRAPHRHRTNPHMGFRPCATAMLSSRSMSPSRQGRFTVKPFIVRKFGAGDGIRTHDPNLGKVVLYP
jgi:O-acetylserine/cysteine efflux transporter